MQQQQQQQQKKIQITKICDLKPYLHYQYQQKNIPLVVDFIVLDPPTLATKRDNVSTDKVMYQALVADETGAILFGIWNYDPENSPIFPGDIMRLTGGFCQLWKNQLKLYHGKYSTLERIGEFSMVFNEAKNMSLHLEWFEEPPGSKRYTARPVQLQQQRLNYQMHAAQQQQQQQHHHMQQRPPAGMKR